MPLNLNGFFWRTEISGQGEKIFFSGGVRNVCGYEAEELSATPGNLLSLIHKEDVGAVLKIYNELTNKKSKSSARHSFRILKKDESILWVKENVEFQKDKSGKVISKRGFVYDITELINEKSELLEKEKFLRENLEAKDRFINILAHDLRAPFTSILGFSEILLNEPNLQQKDKIEYLNYIYEASQSQLQFITYLLDWSRLKTGSLKIEPQRIRIQGIVYNCISALTGNAIRKNIDFQVDIAEDLFFQADERLITQVMTNLLSNAIKFSFEKSAIEITAAVFNEFQVEIVIKDHGIGIPKENHSKIFSNEKTYSTDGTQGEKGSGFGLALVKEIVAKHEGEIWFYSEEGKGSEFHLTLPLPTNTILIVDGNAQDSEFYGELIEDSFPNFKIFSAVNGFEAISIINESHPNLIIASHEMPLMNGIQLMEATRKGDGKIKTPFFVLSEEMSEELSLKYSLLGARAVIKKPVQAQEFTKQLKSILS